MLRFLLPTFLVVAGLVNYACCAAVNCGTGTPCTIEGTGVTCDATAAAAAYCVYKTGSVCTDATQKTALLTALKAKTPCTSLTDTCQCQKAYIQDAITCGTKKTLVACVYKASGDGCGGGAENYVAAKQYASNAVAADGACTASTTACGCEVAYYANPGATATEKCTNAKTFLDCVSAVNPQTIKACDGTKTAADIKTVANNIYTGLTCTTTTPANTATTTHANVVTTTPSGAARLESTLVAVVVTVLVLLTKM